MSFNEAVDGIPLMGKTTRIDKALRLAQREMFSLSNGGRPGRPKVLILLTDGSQTAENDAEDPVKVADEIRAVGVRLLVIGIGKGIDKEELDKIGGGNNVFVASTFDELIREDFMDKLKTGSCGAAKSLLSPYSTGNCILLSLFLSICHCYIMFTILNFSV